MDQQAKDAAEQAKLEKRQKMKEKLLELQRKEQERVRKDTMDAMEAAQEAIKVAEIEKPAQVKKAPNRAAYLTGKSGLKPPTSVTTMKFDLRDDSFKSDSNNAVDPAQTLDISSNSDAQKGAFSIRPDSVVEVEDTKRIAITKMVSELPADSEVDLNKKKMIRKMKRERKKGNLMAMLKTVKRRKDEDLVAEATSELLDIDKESESQPIEVIEDLIVAEQIIQPLESKPRPKLELPMPRRFNQEKLRDWDLEFQQAIPIFTQDQSDNSISRASHKHNSNFLLQAQAVPEPQLLRDILDSLDQDRLFSNIDHHEEKLIEGLYHEDEEFSLIPGGFSEILAVPEELDKPDLEESKTAETVKEPPRQPSSIYENYEIMGGLEKITEVDEEHNITVFDKPKKSSKKKEPKMNSVDFDMQSYQNPQLNFSEEPDMMRVKKVQNDTSMQKSNQSGAKMTHISQSLSNVNMFLKSSTFEDESGNDSLTQKKRSGSFEKIRRDKLLDEDAFSCNTSQYSAFDDQTDQSSVLEDDQTSPGQSQLDDKNDLEFAASDDKLKNIQVAVNIRDSRRVSTLNTNAMNIALEHNQIGRDLKKAMEDARATMIEVAGVSAQIVQKKEEYSSLQIIEEEEGLTFGTINSGQQPNKLKFRNQKAYLRTLVTARQIINDRIKDGTNVDTVKKAEEIDEIGIEVSTIIPLLLVDGDPESMKQTHLHLVQDTKLQRQRISLKTILSQYKDTDKVQDFHLLFKLAVVYFMLGKYENASGFISKAVQHCPKTTQLQNVQLWKGLIYYYYLHSTRKGGFGRNKPLLDQQKYIASIIKSCEEALRSITLIDLIIPAKFTLLKLTLMLNKERFGCDFAFTTIQTANDLSRFIRDIDQYIGQIARAEVYLDGDGAKQAQALDLLNELTKRYPQRIEAYLKLWSIYYNLGNFHQKKVIQTLKTTGFSPLKPQGSDQTSQTQINIAKDAQVQQDERYAQEFFTKTVDTAEKLLIFCTDITETNEKLALLLIITVKGLFKTGAYIKCFELLQKEFTQNPNQSSLLYYYGKYVVKAMAVETKKLQKQKMEHEMTLKAKSLGIEAGLKKKKQTFKVDRGYLGSGIGALEECLRVCLPERQKKVNFYIGFAYKILNMPLKTFTFWKKADERGVKDKTLSQRKQQQVKLFQNEFQLFSLIGDKASELIKAAQKNVAKMTEQQKNEVKEYLQTLKAIESLDRPNSLLFQANLTAYCVETADEPAGFGLAFEQLIEDYPTFIDAHLQFWKYLKFRLGQLSGRAMDVDMSAKNKQAMKKRGLMSAASQVKDQTGVIILEKMHSVAEQALFQSQCTEVPTSLCVEARIIYAKQMLFEKDVEQAVNILHDICFILPQLPIEGLSYIDHIQSQIQLKDENQLEGIIEEDEEAFEIEGRDNAKIKPNFSKGFSASPGKSQRPVSPKKQMQESQKEQKDLKFIRLQTMLDVREQEVNKIGESLNAIVEGTKTQFKKQPLQDFQANVGTRQSGNRRSGIQPVQAITSSHRRFKSNISIGSQINYTRDSGMEKAEARFNDQVNPNRHKSIYNPFVLPEVIPERKSMAFKESEDDDEEALAFKRVSTPGRKQDRYSQVSQSLKNMSPALMMKQGAYEEARPSNEMVFENAVDQTNQDLVKEALKKAQATWIKTTQERQTMLGEINLPTTIEEDGVVFDDISEEEYEDDIFDQPITESENFVVYSNVEFLLLIGKYCAHSSQLADQGLKALNDYLLILDYQKSTATRSQYIKVRALTMFHIGCIYYSQKDIKTAMKFLGPILSDLKRSDNRKQYELAQHKVSKMWRLQFNPQVLLWDYFAYDRQTGRGNWTKYNAKK